MVMQGCILMLRAGAQKSIETFLRSPKIAQYSQVDFFRRKSIFQNQGLLVSDRGCIFKNNFLVF